MDKHPDSLPYVAICTVAQRVLARWGPVAHSSNVLFAILFIVSPTLLSHFPLLHFASWNHYQNKLPFTKILILDVCKDIGPTILVLGTCDLFSASRESAGT